MTEETAAPDTGQAVTKTEAEAPETSWLDGMGDDLKGYVETKGFKDPASLVNSYQNLEKLRGVPAERLLKLPEKMDDAEGMAAVYDRLGRPASADEYTNVIAEAMDKDAYSAIAAKAHEAGLTDAQFATMQAATTEVAKGALEAQETQAAEAFDAWKSANPEGFNNAARMMAKIGVDESALAGILAGDKTEVYGLLAKMAGSMSEGDVIKGEGGGGDSQQFGMTQAAARSKINELFADKTFMEQYRSPIAKVRQEAIEKMESLHKIVAQPTAQK